MSTKGNDSDLNYIISRSIYLHFTSLSTTTDYKTCIFCEAFSNANYFVLILQYDSITEVMASYILKDEQ